MKTKYNLALFLELNEEYKAKKLVAQPPPLKDGPKRLERKRRDLVRIEKTIAPYTKLRGATVLDFGCGRGDLDVALAADYDCKVTGVDVKEYSDWAANEHSNVERVVVDLSEPDNAARYAGRFDAVVSISVLEHVRHPYKALEGIKKVLKPGGVAWLMANLYRGPLASHRYREVHFPWPHLLFTDGVFRKFYAHIGRRPSGAAWVNKLTHLHYRDYFERIGFEVLKETYSTKPIDEEFYQRFEDILGRYPRTDLERDFITVIVRPR